MRAAPLLLVLATLSSAMTLDESDAKFTAASERMSGGDPAGAVADLREVTAFWKEHFGAETEEHALASAQLGVALMNSGQHAAAIPAIETAIEIRSDLYGPTAPKVRGNRHNLARCLSDQKRHEDAAAQLRLVVLSFEEDGGKRPGESISARIDLGAALREKGDHGEAIEAYLAALDIAKDVGRADHPSHGAAHYGIGISAHESGRYELALEHQRKAGELAAGTPALENLSHFNVGRALTKLERWEEALAALDQARLGMASPGQRNEIDDWRARCLVPFGVERYNDADYPKAIAMLREANEIRARLNPDQLAPRAGILWKLAAAERRAGQHEAALTHVDEAIDFDSQANGADSLSVALPIEMSAMILAEQKKIDEAKARARRAAEIRKANDDGNSPWNRAVKAVVIDHAGEPKKALKWLKLAAKQAADTDHEQRGAILSELAIFLYRHGKTKAAEKVEAKMKALLKSAP